jgi:hypothetical protein
MELDRQSSPLAYGTATSQVATLTVNLPQPPTITRFSVGGNGSISLSGTGTPGLACILLTSSNLLWPITWTPAATNYADSNGAFTFSDVLVTHYPQRFYSTRTL